MENNSLLSKLNDLEARFQEVSTLITDPAVVADMKRYVRLNKEYRELELILDARKRYIQLLTSLSDAKDILANESDTDLREMAREEIEMCENEIPKTEEEIKRLDAEKSEAVRAQEFEKAAEIRNREKELKQQLETESKGRPGCYGSSTQGGESTW